MQLPGQQVRAINLCCHGGVCMLSRASVLGSPKGTLCRLACDVISDKWRREQSARSRPDSATSALRPFRGPAWRATRLSQAGWLQEERMSGNKSQLFTGCRALGVKLRQPAEQHPSSSDYRDTTWARAGLIMKGVNHRRGETGTSLRFIAHTV